MNADVVFIPQGQALYIYKSASRLIRSQKNFICTMSNLPFQPIPDEYQVFGLDILSRNPKDSTFALLRDGQGLSWSELQDWAEDFPDVKNLHISGHIASLVGDHFWNPLPQYLLGRLGHVRDVHIEEVYVCNDDQLLKILEALPGNTSDVTLSGVLHDLPLSFHHIGQMKGLEKFKLRLPTIESLPLIMIASRKEVAKVWQAH